MKRVMARPAYAVAVILLVTVAASATENVAGLFALGTSARALGLGGAFGALAGDEGVVFHNPAGLANVEGIGLSSMFVQLYGGVAYGAVTVAMPYVGFSALFLDSGLISTAGGSTRYASQGVVASLGMPIGPVALGARWRFFRVSAPTTGRGWSIDPALHVEAGGVRVSLLYEGALSSPVEYATGGDESFAQSLTVGAALELEPTEDIVWNTSVELLRLFGGSASLVAGVEAWIGGIGARVGYDGTGATFGLSARFTTLQIDWAYAGRTDLGGSHRVSLSLRF